MNNKELEKYLHDHIPLSKAMEVRVRAASNENVILFAPLAPNINHRDTVFGGSASAVAILSAWCLLFVRLKIQAQSGRVIIHKNSMLYEKPISGGFTAIAQSPDEKAWLKLVDALKRNRMARITVTSTRDCDGQKVGQLEGEFVVLPISPDTSSMTSSCAGT